MAGNWGFVGPTYVSPATRWASERAINFYPERADGGAAKSKMRLVGTPGLQVLCTLPTGPVRNLWVTDNLIYAIAGDTLYEVSTSGSFASRGTLNSSSQPAQVSGNGHQLFIVSGAQAFMDAGGPANGANVQPLVDSEDDPLEAVSGTYIDGYFVALIKDSNILRLSGLLADGGVWDPIDAQEKMGSHDRLVRVIADGGQLWLFGQSSTECWYNSGSADFPFDRIQGSTIEMGALPHTIAKLDHSLFYVGSNAQGRNSVYRTQGFLPKRVSNHAVEEALRSMGPTDYPIAYGYSEAGHSFYAVRPPSGTTWVYDTTTDLWHERGVWSGGQWTPHPGNCHAHLYAGKNLIGSATSGHIWIQSLEHTQIAGAPIRRERVCPHVSNENQWMFHTRLTIDTETGTTGGAAPTLNLRWSDDGGKTFCADKAMSLGAAGAYGWRAVRRQLGRSRNRVYSVWTEATTPMSFADAYLDVIPGNGA